MMHHVGGALAAARNLHQQHEICVFELSMKQKPVLLLEGRKLARAAGLQGLKLQIQSDTDILKYRPLE
jgi:hypothetical protein